MVDLVLLLTRLGLSLVFVLAAAGKLASRTSHDDLLSTFELGSWARPAVRALPFAELAVALGLLAPDTERQSAAVAALMLASFSVLLVRQLARGRSTSCNCFGSLGGSMTSRRALGRNLVLLAASLAVVDADAGASAGRASSVLGLGSFGAAALGALLVGAAATVVAVSWAVVRGRRGGARAAVQAGRWRAPELAVGGRRTLVVFLEPHCAPCRSLLPALARSSSDAGRSEPLVVVTDEGSDVDADFAAATAGAWRHVRDRGELAGRLGVTATPAAVVVRPDGSLEEVVVGAPGVARLLGDSALAPARGAPGPEEPEPTVLSRRGFLSVLSLAGAAVATLLGVAGRDHPLWHLRRALAASAAPASSTSPGVSCPSCGSCVICSASSSSPKKLSCGACSQHCSGHKLCATYANEFEPFTALAAYLRGKGFTQDGEVLTYGLERDGKLTVLSGVTKLEGGPSATPTAVLVYELTNGGQNAWAALHDMKGLVASVATVVDGHVVSAGVSPPTSTATEVSPPRAGDSRRELEPASATSSSCADVCAFVLGVAISMLALPAAVVSAPETAALAFAGSLFAGGVGLASGPTGDALSTLLPLVQGATLVDGVIEGLEGLSDTNGETAFCQNFACKLLKFCCTSNGVCYDSDGQCEHDCPAGLAHPLSHCNAYLDGKIVSTLVAP